MVAGPAAAQPLTCGQVITQDTRLDSDLNCFGTGVRTALFIGADGITLDLSGHTISADRSIINDGHDNVTIRNGTLNNDDGPLIQHASGTRLRDLRFQGIVIGLALSDSDHTDVRGSEFVGAVLQIGDGSSWNTVAGNRFSFSEGVVDIGGSHHNRVVDNDFVGPSDSDKIWLADADDNRIAHNRISSLFNGITLIAGSDGNTIVDNVISPELAVYQFDVGIFLSDSSHNLVRGNTVTGNLVGLRVHSGAGNWLVGNRAGDTLGPIRDNEDADGVRVEAGASGTVLANNRADGAADDGIDVEAPGTALRRNRADSNADLGIEAVSGVIDLGGNRASGNGNPLQCLNVSCR
jgi:large repetitive protein